MSMPRRTRRTYAVLTAAPASARTVWPHTVYTGSCRCGGMSTMTSSGWRTLRSLLIAPVFSHTRLTALRSFSWRKDHRIGNLRGQEISALPVIGAFKSLTSTALWIARLNTYYGRRKTCQHTCAHARSCSLVLTSSFLMTLMMRRPTQPLLMLMSLWDHQTQIIWAHRTQILSERNGADHISVHDLQTESLMMTWPQIWAEGKGCPKDHLCANKNKIKSIFFHFFHVLYLLY